MDHVGDVPSSSSGHFRSRVTTTTSYRRINVAASQTETDFDSGSRPSFATSRQNPASPSGWTLFNSLLHSSPQYGGIYNNGVRLLLLVLVLICTLNFTYDMANNTKPIQTTSNVSPLDSLSSNFRLSRLANLHNPDGFEPLVLEPALLDPTRLNITLCICVPSTKLSELMDRVEIWQGFLSVVVVYPDNLSRASERSLKKELRSLARHPNIKNGLSMHMYSHPEHIPPPYNSLMNLARFFSASADILMLYSIFSIDVDSIQKIILEQDLSTTTEGASMLVPGISGTELPSSSVQNEVFDPRSALLVHKHRSPWCPERFISQPSLQWLECLWQVWIFSLGSLQTVVYPEATPKYVTEEVFEGFQVTDMLTPIHELMRPKSRIETCVHVARNLHALSWKEDSSAPLHNRWLRHACSEAFDRWSEAFF